MSSKGRAGSTTPVSREHRERSQYYLDKFGTDEWSAIPLYLRPLRSMTPDDANNCSIRTQLYLLASRVPDLITFQRQLLKARKERIIGPDTPAWIQEEDVHLAIELFTRTCPQPLTPPNSLPALSSPYGTLSVALTAHDDAPFSVSTTSVAVLSCHSMEVSQGQLAKNRAQTHHCT